MPSVVAGSLARLSPSQLEQSDGAVVLEEEHALLRALLGSATRHAQRLLDTGGTCASPAALPQRSPNASSCARRLAHPSSRRARVRAASRAPMLCGDAGCRRTRRRHRGTTRMSPLTIICESGLSSSYSLLIGRSLTSTARHAPRALGLVGTGEDGYDHLRGCQSSFR